MNEGQYPEHDKLKSLVSTWSGEQIPLSDASQIVGEFIEHSGYVLAEWGCRHGYVDYKECDESRECHTGSTQRLWPARGNVQKILGEYFGIDQQKLAEEKDQMLEDIRNAALSQGS